MQTRLHFQRVVAGFDNDVEGKDVQWKEDFTRHPKQTDDDCSKSSRKGKERVSLGGDAGEKEGNGSKSKKRASEVSNVEGSTEQAAKES